MKKIIVTLSILFAASFITNAQVYKEKNKELVVSFFSPTKVEDIDAVNKEGHVFINTTTGAVQMKLAMMQFKFEKPLMEEHFNENYVESEKYPHSTFKGKINEKIDYAKDGENKVTVTGTLNLHGVDKEVTIPGTLTVQAGELKISSIFRIKFADYNVTIENYYKGILPEDTEVKVNATMEPVKIEPKK